MLRTTLNTHAQKRSPKGRMALAIVTIGASVIGGQAVLLSDTTAGANDITFAASSAANDNIDLVAAEASAPAGTVQVLNVNRALDPSAFAQQLATAQRFSDERAAREAALRQPLFQLPAIGVLTSTFGQRWGTLHGGIDIAGPIGTPIVAVAGGEVIDSGPAAGFGLWVRVRHDDGTVTVYGHNDTNTVSVGQRVEAGQQIATMGNRGFSTGPHVHFEVWINGDQKIDPIGWLSSKGVNVFGNS
ncbi:M23 family metallopeptidase [Lolliginicoccus suaedae]|uniref:M23 family metallopeptidase n=1 Tax=Lolliginicoccus suaedae TaxID=2605429 RepID=UPI0011EBA292|nr:M23 family metallopeptidase [Lolliginicoccus suaedae]